MITLLGLIVLLQILTIILLQQKHGWSGRNYTNAAIVDSCVLIDGRIIELAKTGFVSPKLIIPSCVISELQQMADGQNMDKRQRARFGLDVVQELQNNRKTHVALEPSKPSVLPVDDQLVELALKKRYKLMTIDFNLIKVAAVEGVEVLNINELALKLRPVMLPGELLTVTVHHKGAAKNQGVGYGEDGSMTVIDGAGRLVGKEVNVEITRSLQTESGKMFFAKLATKKVKT